jgi:hypothetical protein
MQVKRIKLFLDLHKRPCKLNQNKKFVSSVLSMWLIHVSEKNRTILAPSQSSCKLSENKIVQ